MFMLRLDLTTKAVKIEKTFEVMGYSGSVRLDIIGDDIIFRTKDECFSVNKKELVDAISLLTSAPDDYAICEGSTLPDPERRGTFL